MQQIGRIVVRLPAPAQPHAVCRQGIDGVECQFDVIGADTSVVVRHRRIEIQNGDRRHPWATNQRVDPGVLLVGNQAEPQPTTH